MADLIFGKYEIQHRLAIGGMGEVFYATQKGVPGFERPVILKSLLPDLALQEGFIDQFLDEARVAATLNHPNVVSIYEVGLWNGTYFIAMEYIRGRNLSQLIRKAIEQQVLVPAPVAGRIIHDAAVGLDHAHHAVGPNGASLNIVHRDISPQNIMVREDGVTKVVDFGIAHASNRAASRTATGALKGKLAYMAPEQIAGQTTALVDQWALGVVFWELLTSRRLFKAESDILIARKVMEEAIPPPSTVVANVPAPIEAAVMRMLERNHHKRFESCADAAAAIEQAMVGLTPSGGSPVTAFMRRLGTEDLSARVKSPIAAPASNFVISLKPSDEGLEAVEVDLSTRTPVAASLKQPSTGARANTGRPATDGSPAATQETTKRNLLWLALAAVVIALLSGGALFGFKRGVAGPATDAEPPTVTPTPTPTPAPNVAAIEPPKPPVFEVVDAGPPPVEAVKLAHLHLDTIPSGAFIRLDGKPLGLGPQDVDALPNAVHYVLVEKPGYRRAEQEATGAPDQKVDVILKLVPLERPPVVPPPVATAAAERGFLTLETKPWTTVNIDGDPYGLTPVVRKPFTSGKHTVEMTNEAANIHVTRVVEIAPNKLTKLNLTLP